MAAPVKNSIPWPHTSYEQMAFRGDEGIFSPELPQLDWRKLFWYAAYGGQVALMKEMEKRTSIEKLISIAFRGDTPLHAAARRAHVKAIEYLLHVGIYVNLRNKYGQTPLVALLLERDGDRKTAAEYLLARGAFLDLRDDFGNTARSLLSQRGWDIPELSREQRLFQAIDMESVEGLSEVLQEFEANQGPILNQGGETPFHRVLFTTPSCTVHSLALRLLSVKKDMFQKLAEKFDRYAKDRWGETTYKLAKFGLESAQKKRASEDAIRMLKEIVAFLKPPQEEQKENFREEREGTSCILL